MNDRTTVERGHVEVHTMADSGRTIRVRCLCPQDGDHQYAKNEADAQPRRPLRLR